MSCRGSLLLTWGIGVAAAMAAAVVVTAVVVATVAVIVTIVRLWCWPVGVGLVVVMGSGTGVGLGFGIVCGLWGRLGSGLGFTRFNIGLSEIVVLISSGVYHTRTGVVNGHAPTESGFAVAVFESKGLGHVYGIAVGTFHPQAVEVHRGVDFLVGLYIETVNPNFVVSEAVAFHPHVESVNV